MAGKTQVTLNFTATELKRALKMGCLNRKQRLHLVDILENCDIADNLSREVAELRKKKDPMGHIILASVLLGLEAGLKLAGRCTE